MPALMSKYGIDRVGLLKVDIEGGEFALLGAGEDLCWLSRVDQAVLEVHGSHGDPMAMVGRLQEAGFRVDLRDNDGRRERQLRSARLRVLLAMTSEAGQHEKAVGSPPHHQSSYGHLAWWPAKRLAGSSEH